jgi:hypothetical protein
MPTQQFTDLKRARWHWLHNISGVGFGGLGGHYFAGQQDINLVGRTRTAFENNLISTKKK